MIIRRKIFHNSIIRYFYTGAIKLQMIACDILFAGFVLTFGNVIQWLIAVMTFVAIYGINFKYFFYLRSNRDQLNTFSMKARIGSLYEPFEIMSPRFDYYPIEYYSLVFHLRRTLFVATTFLLFNYPGLQVMFFMQTNILYMIYVGHITFFTEKKTQWLEVFNEFIGIIMCYSYLMFVNIVNDRE